MRNLKRVLSLALAVVMVIGMMVMTTSAADFTDVDEITYTEAVDVLGTLNVINGRDDGSFDPTGSVTRAEMAKMICVVHNGGKDPLLGVNADTMFTDTANHWAKAYIAYAANLGIISGMGDGTFAPDAKVTGTQAAKMLLVTLGYDPDVFALVGNDWDTSTEVIANGINMFDGLEGTNLSNALTREKAAQMIYNALNAYVMRKSYDKVLSNGEISYNYSLTTQTLLNKTYGAYKVEGVVEANEFADVNAADSALRDGTTQIRITNQDEIGAALAVTNGTLATFKVSTGNDLLGRAVILFVRPSTSSTATVKATVIGEPIVDDINTVTVTTGNKKAAPMVAGWLGAQDLAVDDGVTVLVNDYDPAGTVANIGALTNLGNGTEVVAIDNDGNGDLDFVFTTKLALSTIAAINNSAETVTLSGNNGTLVVYDQKDVVGLEGRAVGDIVLYGEFGGRLYLETPETVTGIPSNVDNDYTLTINGKKYQQSAMANYTDLPNTATYTNTKNHGTFYLDFNGYVMAADLSSAVSVEEIVYIADKQAQAGTNWASQYEVYCYFTDGTQGAYTVASINGLTKPNEINSGVTATQFYAYSITADGKIALKDATAVDLMATGYGELNDTSIATPSNAVVKGKTAYTIDGNAYYLNKDTAIFFHDTNNGTVGSLNYMVTTNILGLPAGTTAVDPSTVEVAYVTVNGQNIVLAIYVDYNGVIAASVSNDYFFLANKNWNTGDIIESYNRVAVAAGQTTAQDLPVITGDVGLGVGLYKYVVDGKGRYDLTALTYGTDAAYAGAFTYVPSANKVIMSDGTEIKLGNAVIVDATGANKLSAGKDLDTVTAAFLKNAAGFVVVDNTTDKNAVAIYVTAKISETSVVADDAANNRYKVSAPSLDQVKAGPDTIAYQWQNSTDGGTTWADVAGATSATLADGSVPATTNALRVKVTATTYTGSYTIVTYSNVLAVSGF